MTIRTRKPDDISLLIKDLLKEPEYESYSPWPALFVTGSMDVYVEEAKTDYLTARLHCCADVFMAWGMCMSGMHQIPEMFGEGMVRAQTFLGVRSILPEDLTPHSDAWLAEHKARG